MTLLTSPVFTGLVLVLVLNDQVLKRSFPGLVTGKLSDFAGVALVAMVLGVLTGRVAPAVVFTGVGFVALKTVPGVAEVVSPLLGGVTRRDTTDLVALVALIPTTHWLTQRLQLPSARDFATLVGVMSVGVVALLATTGTSCSAPARVDVSVASDGELVAAIVRERSKPEWAESRDGIVWRSVVRPPSRVGAVKRVGCFADVSCFRVLHGRVDARSGHGAWSREYGLTHDQLRNADERVSCGGPIARFTSIATRAGDGGPGVVVIGMGDDGVLVRSPEGHWDRRALLDLEPVRTDGPNWLLWLPNLVLLGSFMVLVAWFVAGGAMTGRWFRGRTVIGAAGLGFAVLMVGHVVTWFAMDFADAGRLRLAMAGGVFLITLVVAVSERRTRDRTSAPSDPFLGLGDRDRRA